MVLSGHTGPVGGVAFSPDGSKVASTSVDGTAKIWDARNGRGFLSLGGHLGGVEAVAFSPDGRTLATVGQDGGLRLYVLGIDDL